MFFPSETFCLFHVTVLCVNRALPMLRPVSSYLSSFWQSIGNMAIIQTLMEIYIELCIYLYILLLHLRSFYGVGFLVIVFFCLFSLFVFFWLCTALRTRQNMTAKNNSTKTIQRLREEIEFQGLPSPAAMREDRRY